MIAWREADSQNGIQSKRKLPDSHKNEVRNFLANFKLSGSGASAPIDAWHGACMHCFFSRAAVVMRSGFKLNIINALVNKTAQIYLILSWRLPAAFCLRRSSRGATPL